jgi:hypothetical protein
MKQILKAAATIALISVSGSALAQAPAPAPAAPAAPAAPGAMAPGADISTDVIVTALNNTQTEVGELARAPAGASIELVELTDYLKGPDASRIDAALTSNEMQLEALHTALESNPTIMAELQADVKIDNVVGVDVTGDKILIFWQPTPEAAGGAAAPGGGGAAPPAAPR